MKKKISPFVPLFKVHVNLPDAIGKLTRALSSGYINEGVEVAEFKEGVTPYIAPASSMVTLTNSCTSAITLALKLCGVGPGSHVISTSMTCIASNTPIDNLGAEIAWADIDPRTGMLSVETIEEAINDVHARGGHVDAIIYVAWSGSPGDLDAIHSYSLSKGIPLIVDAAHALDARINGMHLIEYADFVCYSFQAIKHLTTGDGGALVISDMDDVDRAGRLKWFGIDRDSSKDEKGDWKGNQWDVAVDEAGYKFNMNNMAAALGLSQLPHISEILRKHRTNASIYRSEFSDSLKIVPLEIHRDSTPSDWVFTVKYHGKKPRDEIVAELNARGVGAGIVHSPNHFYACFSAFKQPPKLPMTEAFAREQFSIPCGWWVTEDRAREIAAIVKEVCT